MATHWSQALVQIASAQDPTNLLSEDRVLFYDEHTITIYDKFAKAKYHFLVLPRIPFKTTMSVSSSQAQRATPTLSAANGKLNLGATSSNSVPASHMKSISTLLASPYAANVLEAVRKTSERVLQHIRDDMKKQYGITWDIERAFHAVPSMVHLHLHVISMDLVSERLKHKKHFLSFHPAVGFALRLNEVDAMIKQGRKSLPKSESAYEKLLKGPLRSHHTGQVARAIPELKAHLESYWHNKILAVGRTPAAQAAENGSAKRVVYDKEFLNDSIADQRPRQSRKLEPCSTAVGEPFDSEDDEVSLPVR